MPFDGANFRSEPPRPERDSRTERIWAAIIIVSAVIMLVMPVSAVGILDLVRYVRGTH